MAADFDRVLEAGTAEAAVDLAVAERPDRARVFQPFHRESTDGTGSPVTALGPSIARSVAQAQRGSVEYSPRAGGGSVFALKLPAASIEGL